MPDLVDRIADELLPFDGIGVGPVAATAVITELVRRLNHLRRPLAPQDVDQMVANLHSAAQRLPQVLQQIGSQLRQTATNPLLAATGERPAQEVAQLAARHLYAAAEEAFEVGHRLDTARQLTSRLYLDE